jgi:hypothetical protein
LAGQKFAKTAERWSKLKFSQRKNRRLAAPEMIVPSDVRIEFDEQTFVVFSAEKIGQVATKSDNAADRG